MMGIKSNGGGSMTKRFLEAIKFVVFHRRIVRDLLKAAELTGFPSFVSVRRPVH
jgi:hypothetical protein